MQFSQRAHSPERCSSVGALKKGEVDAKCLGAAHHKMRRTKLDEKTLSKYLFKHVAWYWRIPSAFTLSPVGA